MELKDLEYFKVLCETKSFTNTAERLFISQPTISNSIKKLEAQLHAQLINREKFKTNLEITPEGLLLLESINKILYHKELLLKKLETSNLCTKDNTIKLGLPPLTGNSLLKKYLLSFFSTLKYEEIDSIALIEDNNIALQKKILNNELDFCISYHLDRKQTSHEITSIKLTDMKFHVYASKNDNFFSNQKIINISDLKNKIFVSLKKPTVHYDLIHSIIYKYKLNPKNIIYVDNFESIQSLIQNGLYISLFGEGSCSSNPNITSFPINDNLNLEIYLEYKSNRILNENDLNLIKKFI